MLVWNTLAIYGGPLLFAWLFYWMGSRQHMRSAWIVTGVGIVCIVGGFQDLSFYDTGCEGCGHLDLTSGLLPPFPHFAESIARAAMNLTIAGGVWWWVTTRKKISTVAQLHIAQT
jgi:hypothetical protein